MKPLPLRLLCKVICTGRISRCGTKNPGYPEQHAHDAFESRRCGAGTLPVGDELLEQERQQGDGYEEQVRGDQDDLDRTVAVVEELAQQSAEQDEQGGDHPDPEHRQRDEDRHGEQDRRRTVGAVDRAAEVADAIAIERLRDCAHQGDSIPADAVGKRGFQSDQRDPVAADGEMDDEGGRQRIAQAGGDDEAEHQRVVEQALDMHRVRRPTVEHAPRHGQQGKGQQAGDDQFEFVGALAQAFERDTPGRDFVLSVVG
ncbi:MAG: hypothetical protein NVV60_13295 [Luteimonas sp.]|nr:hypothetical protein [Luteimonas sp.]